MAKNRGYDPTDMARQQENIRKAKGNPNKNVHRRKNGSNYGGGDYLARREAERREHFRPKRESIFDLSPMARTVFLVLLGVTAVLLLLSLTAFKGHPAAGYVPSLSVGALCCFMAWVGFSNRKKSGSAFGRILLAALAVFGVLYTLAGILGLAVLLGA